MFVAFFPENSSLDEAGSSLFDFASTTNFNLHKMFLRRLLVLINIFNEGFNKFIFRSKASCVVPQFKNAKGGLWLNLLSVVSMSFRSVIDQLARREL